MRDHSLHGSPKLEQLIFKIKSSKTDKYKKLPNKNDARNQKAYIIILMKTKQNTQTKELQHKN